MIRSHFRNTEIRKAELDPASFDHAKQLTPEDRAFRGCFWRCLIVGLIAFWGGVAWWVWSVI